MRDFKQFTFRPATRGGGNGKKQIADWDYCVDDRSLHEWLKVGDFIPPFGWLRPESDVRFRQMLLLKSPGNLTSGRVPLFVCAECADYGCGVLSAIVEKDSSCIIWRSFAFERDGEVRLLKDHRQPRLLFDKTAYWTAISQLPPTARTQENSLPT